MQNKGAIKFIAIALALVCVYQLSFTYVTKRVEKNAKAYAKGDSKREFHYLDSVATETASICPYLKSSSSSNNPSAIKNRPFINSFYSLSCFSNTIISNNCLRKFP